MGDRDYGIIREHKDTGIQEPFYGSCPVKIHTEFRHNLVYVEHNDDVHEAPASYSKESNDSNYLENTNFVLEYQTEFLSKL